VAVDLCLALTDCLEGNFTFDLGDYAVCLGLRIAAPGFRLI